MNQIKLFFTPLRIFHIKAAIANSDSGKTKLYPTHLCVGHKEVAIDVTACAYMGLESQKALELLEKESISATLTDIRNVQTIESNHYYIFAHNRVFNRC